MPRDLDGNVYAEGTKGEDCQMGHATQMGVEAAIAKNEVEHLNSKRIQDKIECLEEEDEIMHYHGGDNCGGGFGGGMGGMLLGMMAAGGFGWGGRGHGGFGGDGCGGHGHHDTIEILRDNHDGVLSLKSDISNNALRECEARHEDAMRFQCGLDRNELKTVEVACKLEKDMFCGFKDISDKLCIIEKDALKRELCEAEQKLQCCREEKEELREIIRDNKQTQTLLDAIRAGAVTSVASIG